MREAGLHIFADEFTRTIYTALIGAAGRAWCAELSEVHLQRMPE
jgi:hypothetical protein